MTHPLPSEFKLPKLIPNTKYDTETANETRSCLYYFERKLTSTFKFKGHEPVVELQIYSYPAGKFVGILLIAKECDLNSDGDCMFEEQLREESRVGLE